jgi:hypothetical protein
MFHSSRGLESGPLLDAVIRSLETLPDAFRAEDRHILKGAVALRAQLRLDLDQEEDAVSDLVWLAQLDDSFQFDTGTVSPKILELQRRTLATMTGRIRLPSRTGSKVWVDNRRLDGLTTVPAQPGPRHVLLEIRGGRSEGAVDVREGRETAVGAPPERRAQAPTQTGSGGGGIRWFIRPPRVLTVRIGSAIDYLSDEKQAPLESLLSTTTYTIQAPAAFGTELGATLRIPRTPFSLGATRLTTNTKLEGAFDTGWEQGTAKNLRRTQEAFHGEIGFSIGGDKKEFAIFAGPSIISAKQQLLVSVNPVTKTYSYQEIQTERVRGFNIGMDFSYLPAKYIGVGLGLRYTRAFADIRFLGDDLPLQLGGYQLGMGARLRF